MLTTLLLALAPQGHPPLRWQMHSSSTEPAKFAEVQVVLLDGDGQLLVDGWSVAASQALASHTAVSREPIDGETGDCVITLGPGTIRLTVKSPRHAPYPLGTVELEPATRTSVVLQLRGPDPMSSVYAQVPYSSLELLGEGERLVAVRGGRRFPMQPLEQEPRVWVASGLEEGMYRIEVDVPHLQLAKPVLCENGRQSQVILVGSSALKLVAPEGTEPPRAVRVFRRRIGEEAWAQAGRWDSKGSSELPVIRRLAPGDYTVLVQHASGAKQAYEVQGLGPQEERELELDAQPGHEVRLELLTSSGDPVVHQPFSLRPARRLIPGAERLQAYARRRFGNAVALLDSVATDGVTGEDGRATLSGIGSGPHIVDVQPETWFPARIPVELDEGAAVVRAVLPAALDLELVVDGAEVAASDRLVVAMAPEGKKVRLVPDSLRVVDEEGRCKFPLVPHGTMTFIVVRRVGGGEQELLLAESIAIDESTPNPLRLRVP